MNPFGFGKVPDKADRKNYRRHMKPCAFPKGRRKQPRYIRDAEKRADREQD